MAGYPDWGALNQLTTFLTDLDLAVATNQATATEIATAIGTLGLAVQADQATASAIATAIGALGLATDSLQATAAQISAAIAAEGVPLLHGYQLITNNTTWTAAAVSSYFSSIYTLPSPGYQFAIQVTIANAAAGNPFPRVVLSFLTAPSGGVKVDEIDFYVPATSSGDYWIYGGGPAPTPYVQVEVQNFDGTYGLSGQYLLGSSTLQRNRHDWRCLPGGTVPGHTLPPISNPNALILAATSTGGLTIAAASSETYVLPLYSGQAQLSALLGTTPNPGVQYSINLPQFTAGPPVWEFNSVATELSSQPFILPRSVTTFTITNNNGVSSINFQFGISALEYAS